MTAGKETEALALLVDDSRRQRALLKQFLEKGGLCRVMEAESAQKAFEFLGLGPTGDRPKPDLVIMDVMMPEIDGIEATRRIKSHPELRDLPIMIVTGIGETELLEAAFKAGASDYIVKPVLAVELLARARSLLTLKRETDMRLARERELEETVQKLKEALAEVKALSGLLPICAHCKKIRDDEGYWQQVEIYLTNHSEAKFSHGICPDCLVQKHPQYADRVLERVKNKKGGRTVKP